MATKTKRLKPSEYEDAREMFADAPKSITDNSSFDLLLLVWDYLLRYGGSKAAVAIRALGDWIADDMGLHEKSLDRIAVRKVISGWATKLRGKQRNALHDLPQRQGALPNPFFNVWEGDKQLTVADVILANLWKRQKSEVSLKLNSAGGYRVDTGRKDASGNPLDPIAVDLSEIEWTEAFNARVDTEYRIHTPAMAEDTETTDDEIFEDLQVHVEEIAAE